MLKQLSLRVAGRSRKLGFVLVTGAIASVVMIGSLGLALDLGRMFIVRTEVQNWVDSAAIRGALELDGTRAGLTAGETMARTTAGRWDLSTNAFVNPAIEFGTSDTGPWSDAAAAPLNSRFCRVKNGVQVKLYFMPVVTAQRNGRVAAEAIGAQIQKTGFGEGVFPFSPFAHATTPPNFGLIPGNLYTLRWPTNPTLGTGKSGHNSNMCPGDRDAATLDKAMAMGGSERGYIEDGSSSIIRATIEADYQSVFLDIGSLVNFTGGAKQTQLDSLETRISQDSDSSSLTYSNYLSSGSGNGRRIILCPVNDGGTPLGSNERVVTFGAFFLRPTGEYGNGGNQAWCAEFIGGYLEGGRKKSVENNGAWVVRLVR